MIDKLFKEKIKKLLFKFTSLGAPTYSYNLDPLQLSEIINSLEKVKKINGNICEVGVARGKRQVDKRQDKKKRDWQREKSRLLREKG